MGAASVTSCPSAFSFVISLSFACCAASSEAIAILTYLSSNWKYRSSASVPVELTCLRRRKGIFCGGRQVTLARKTPAWAASLLHIAGWARHLLDQVLIHHIGAKQGRSPLAQPIQQCVSRIIHGR